MKSLLMGGVALLVVAGTNAAKADYAFSGAGQSGHLVGSSETWDFNYDGGLASTGYHNDWGSPGVGAGTVAYGESSAAYGMIITFAGGGPIDTPSIAQGNASACVGSTGGGTTFCTISPTDIWQAFQVGSNSIEFLAQSATYYLTQGQQYFVNIFFDGATPTSFTGKWLTDFTPVPVPVPEPKSLAMLAIGVAAIGFISRKKLRGASAAAA